MSSEPPDPDEPRPGDDPSVVDFGAMAFILVLVLLGLLLMLSMVRH